MFLRLWSEEGAEQFKETETVDYSRTVFSGHNRAFVFMNHINLNRIPTWTRDVVMMSHP